MLLRSPLPLLLAAALAACTTSPAGAPAPAEPVHATASLPGGLSLHYVELGPRSAPPLVLLHGYTDSFRSFDLNLSPLARRFHVYAVDQRGHGRSSRPECCYALADFARDVVAFMDSVGLRRATLVGHSMGSFVAQAVALEHPERVSALVLIGSAPGVAGNPVALELAKAVDALQDPVDPTFIREFQASTFVQPLPPGFLDTAVAESQLVPAHVWKATLEGLLQVDHTARLPALHTPTLVVGGDKDGFFSVAQQQALADALPNGTLALYADTGHAPHVERPERFAADVEAFLAWQQP